MQISISKLDSIIVILENIFKAIHLNRIKITEHAYDEAQNDNLTFDEIFFSIFQGEIIEDYPKDKPYPSCLVYGKNFKGESIHSVWSYNDENEWVVLITVYRPDPNKWIEGKIRKKK